AVPSGDVESDSRTEKDSLGTAEGGRRQAREDPDRRTEQTAEGGTAEPGSRRARAAWTKRLRRLSPARSDPAAVPRGKPEVDRRAEATGGGAAKGNRWQAGKGPHGRAEQAAQGDARRIRSPGSRRSWPGWVRPRWVRRRQTAGRR